ncbi:MAG: spherulation-specific family 4 protein [Acidimicrobiales bacterium]
MPNRGRWSVGLSLLLIGASAMTWLLLPSASIEDHPATVSARTTDFVQQLAIPAYADPTANPGTWDQLTGGEPGAIGIIVANVDSGPGSRSDPAWASVIQRARAAGTTVLGYVDTGYLGNPSEANPAGLPTRSGPRDVGAWLNQVEADIDDWYAFYGANLGGIFLDQTTSECGPLPGSNIYADEYRTLTAYVKRTHPGAMTVLNPGIAVPRCFDNAADVLVTFEGSYANYVGTPGSQGKAYQPLDWAPSSPDKVWHIVYGADSSVEMVHAMALGRSRDAGYVYVTDAGPPNPFGVLPPTDYWSAEQGHRSP